MSEKSDKISMSPVREAGLRKQDATEGESGNPNRAGSAAGSRTPNPALTHAREVWETLVRAEDDPGYDEQDIARLAEAIAAAEERGRRRGVAERNELRQIIRGMQPTYCEHTCPVGTLHESICADAQAALAPRDSAPCPDPPPGALEAAEASARRGGQVGCGNIATYQAPRDSAPVCDAMVSSDPFREWRCGKQKGHAGPHSGEAPRDSGPSNKENGK